MGVLQCFVKIISFIALKKEWHIDISFASVSAFSLQKKKREKFSCTIDLQSQPPVLQENRMNNSWLYILFYKGT